MHDTQTGFAKHTAHDFIIHTYTYILRMRRIQFSTNLHAAKDMKYWPKHKTRSIWSALEHRKPVFNQNYKQQL